MYEAAEQSAEVHTHGASTTKTIHKQKNTSKTIPTLLLNLCEVICHHLCQHLTLCEVQQCRGNATFKPSERQAEYNSRKRALRPAQDNPYRNHP